jgi:hypothetical protein
VSVNVVPQLQECPVADAEWLPDNECIKDAYFHLRKVRERLKTVYNNEFLVGLVNQATDRNSRYKPVTQRNISQGDIVLLNEDYTKAQKYPMGLVQGVQINSNGEVTCATVKKGQSGEIVKRHVTTLIPFLSDKNTEEPFKNVKEDNSCCYEKEEAPMQQMKRKAAIQSR